LRHFRITEARLRLTHHDPLNQLYPWSSQ
jgi:hypothetical protein